MVLRSNDTEAYDLEESSPGKDGFAENVYTKLESESPRVDDPDQRFHSCSARVFILNYLERIDATERALQPDPAELERSQGISDREAMEILGDELECFNRTDDAYGDLRKAYDHLVEYVERKNLTC